jgi:hypothetical protein
LLVGQLHFVADRDIAGQPPVRQDCVNADTAATTAITASTAGVAAAGFFRVAICAVPVIIETIRLRRRFLLAIRPNFDPLAPAVCSVGLFT